MSCYHVAADQPRYVRNRHEDDCPATNWHPPLAPPECAGCQECARPHCLIQWHGDRGDCLTHAESVCPACLGKVREHIDEIVRLSGMPLLEQVIRKGSPDTEAADLLGPVADQGQWRSRIEQGVIHDPEATLGGNHPLWVLGRWDMLVTEHLGHRRTRKVKIRSAGRYLDTNLTWLAVDPSFDIALFAREIAECRQHLERVLQEGEQVETGAPCMECGGTLRRVWQGDPLPWKHRDDSHPPAPEDCWACSRCKVWRDDRKYRLNVSDLHTGEAAWLTSGAMEIRTGVRAGTVREWARRIESAFRTREPLVRKRRHGGRTEYAVEDVERVAREKGMMSA